MELESTFGERLRFLMEERGLRYEEFGRLLNIPPQTLNRYVLGRREPSLSTAADIAQTLGVDLLWLRGCRAPRAAHVAAFRPPDPQTAVTIVHTVRWDTPLRAPALLEGYAPADVPDPERHIYFRAPEASMTYAGILPGDLVLIRLQDQAERGQVVLCLTKYGEGMLRRYLPASQVLLFLSAHPAWPPDIIPLEELASGQFRILGVVVRVLRDL